MVSKTVRVLKDAQRTIALPNGIKTMHVYKSFFWKLETYCQEPVQLASVDRLISSRTNLTSIWEKQLRNGNA